MIGLGQEDDIEKIIFRPEIWWHDVVYHEADHGMKWPHPATVRIFWSQLAESPVILITSYSAIVANPNLGLWHPTRVEH